MQTILGGVFVADWKRNLWYVDPSNLGTTKTPAPPPHPPISTMQLPTASHPPNINVPPLQYQMHTPTTSHPPWYQLCTPLPSRSTGGYIGTSSENYSHTSNYFYPRSHWLIFAKTICFIEKNLLSISKAIFHKTSPVLGITHASMNYWLHWNQLLYYTIFIRKCVMFSVYWFTLLKC